MSSNPANIPNVASIAALIALGAASSKYPTVRVEAFNAGSAYGGGIFDWDSASTATPVSGIIVAAAGVSTGRWNRRPQQPHNIDVTNCGAQPGVTSTANNTAIETAFAYAASLYAGTPGEQPMVTWAPGRYTYSGTGIIQSGANVLTSAPPSTVSVNITQSVYFLTNTGFVQSSNVSGIHWIGGKGAILYSITTQMVGGYHLFENNIFDSYSECAVACNASDNPYLKFLFNQLIGTSTSTGLAWAGAADDGQVFGNAFNNNAYHLKIGGNGFPSQYTVRDNSFLSFTANNTIADIWIVPYVASGSVGLIGGKGVLIDHNKFGSENLNVAAPRILIALENTGTGTGHQNYPPLLVWQNQATNVSMYGVGFSHNTFYGAGTETAPIIKAYCNNVGSFQFDEDNLFAGSPYTYLIQFMGTWTGNSFNRNWYVQFSQPVAQLDQGQPFSIGVSNGSIGVILDPDGIIQGQPGVAYAANSVGDDTTLAILGGAAGFGDLSLIGSTSTATADARGNGTTAANVTVTGNGLSSYCFSGFDMTGQTPNRLAWAKFDLAQGLALSLPNVSVGIINSVDLNNALIGQNITLNSGWQTYIIPFIIPDSADPSNWLLRFTTSAYVVSTATQFRIANTGIFLAGQLPNTTNLSIMGVNSGAWNGAHQVMGSYHLWIDTSGRLRIKSGAPTSATDGTIVGTQS